MPFGDSERKGVSGRGERPEAILVLLVYRCLFPKTAHLSWGEGAVSVRSLDLSPVITQENYNMGQKGTLRLLIKVMETTEKLNKGLGGWKCCSLGWVGKFLQSLVRAAKWVHRAFEGLGRCQGACGRARGQ